MRLESGRDRQQLGDHLLDVMARDPRVVIGLDFAFSLPLWYLRELGVVTAAELWQLVASEGEGWLAACQAPWWGRKHKPRPANAEHYRRCELELQGNGIRPKSVFQVGGAGSVGTGSIRGMPLLHRLHEAGASVWPFDPPGWPLVLEIYPRLLTGAVVKSNAAARATYIAEKQPGLKAWPIPSEDAFDAAVSALVMAKHVHELSQLSEAESAQQQLEGAIWQPRALAVDWPRGDHRAGAVPGS